MCRFAKKKRGRGSSKPACSAGNNDSLPGQSPFREIVPKLSVSIGARLIPMPRTHASLHFMGFSRLNPYELPQMPPEKTKPPSLRSVFRTGHA
jgi:hypothetical protein